MRACERMNVQRALAVGNLTSKNPRTLALGGACQHQNACQKNVGLAFHDYSFFIYCSTTVNFRCMPSCSSLQTTVQTASYSPGSLGAVSRNSCVPGLNNKSQPSTLLRSFARSSVNPWIDPSRFHDFAFLAVTRKS